MCGHTFSLTVLGVSSRIIIKTFIIFTDKKQKMMKRLLLLASALIAVIGCGQNQDGKGYTVVKEFPVEGTLEPLSRSGSSTTTRSRAISSRCSGPGTGGSRRTYRTTAGSRANASRCWTGTSGLWCSSVHGDADRRSSSTHRTTDMKA